MIIAEHTKTASYGSYASAKEYRTTESMLINKGHFLRAQDMGINDLRNKFGSKYNTAITQMRSYTVNTLGYFK